MKRPAFASWLLVFFVALFWAGAFLGDLVGIGGYDGIAPEALYEEFQFGDVPSWLYQLTEIGTLAALSIGFFGSALSIVAMMYFLGARLLRRMCGAAKRTLPRQHP